MTSFKLNTAFWKLFKVIWQVLCIFSLLGFFLSFIPTNHGSTAYDKGAKIFWVVSIFISGWGYNSATYQIRLRASCQLYKNILSSNYIRSVEELAAAANQPIDEVKKNIKELQTKELLTDLHFVTKNYAQESTDKDDPEVRVVVMCVNCGASNSILSNGGGTCEYCSSHLTLPQAGRASS